MSTSKPKVENRTWWTSNTFLTICASHRKNLFASIESGWMGEFCLTLWFQRRAHTCTHSGVAGYVDTQKLPWIQSMTEAKAAHSWGEQDKQEDLDMALLRNRMCPRFRPEQEKWDKAHVVPLHLDSKRRDQRVRSRERDTGDIWLNVFTVLFTFLKSDWTLCVLLWFRCFLRPRHRITVCSLCVCLIYRCCFRVHVYVCLDVYNLVYLCLHVWVCVYINAETHNPNPVSPLEGQWRWLCRSRKTPSVSRLHV